MIVEVDDTLFELKETKDVRACSKCDLRDDCNDLSEALCTKVNGFGKYFEQMDSIQEAVIREEASMAYGKETWR